MLKAFSFRGIRGKLLLLLLVVLLPILLIEAFVYYQRFETRKSEELRANLELARAVAKNFDIFVQDLVHTELVVGLALTASQQITESDRNRILDESQAENPAVRSIFWMNDQGLVIASSLRSYVGFNLSDRSFFQRVKEGQKWAVSELIVGRATNKPGFTVSRGIRNKEGELLGIVAAAIEPDRLDTVLGVERARDAGLSLIDNKGMHVYRHPVTEYSWEQRNWLNLYPIIQDSLEGREVTTIHTSKLTGKNRLVAFAPVSSIGWVAAASSAEDEVMKEITSTLLFQAGLGLLVMLAAFGAAVVLSRPISNSIIGLRNHALAIGRGQMESVAPITAPEELKDLAVAFDRMAEEIRSREAALRESEEKARNLIRHAPAAVYELDVKGTRFLSVNEAMCEITGYTREELLAMSPISMVDESSRAAFRERIKRKLAGDKLEEVVEYRVPTKDGRMLIVAIHASSFSYRDGKPETVLVIAHDVTERKRAEEALRKAYDDLEMRVRDRTAELSQALERLRVENIQRKLLEDTLRESETQVRFFASQCLTAQETERKRIAGELHDSIAASLGAVISELTE